MHDSSEDKGYLTTVMTCAQDTTSACVTLPTALPRGLSALIIGVAFILPGGPRKPLSEISVRELCPPVETGVCPQYDLQAATDRKFSFGGDSAYSQVIQSQ